MTSISKPAISHPFKKEEKTFVLMGKKKSSDRVGGVGITKAENRLAVYFAAKNKIN